VLSQLQTTIQPLLDRARIEGEAAVRHLTAKNGLMTDLASALVALIVTLFIARWVSNGVRRLSTRWVHSDADRTLPEFASQVVYWMIFTLGVVVMLNRLGIETASFITVLGAASLSIGLALQGTLGNVASGLMLLFNKPYRIGDVVKVGEVTGRVHRLGIFNTEINDLSNTRVFVPNSKIFSNEITNLTTNHARRIEIDVEVDYSTNLEAAIALLREVSEAQAHQLGRDIWVGAHSFNASGIGLKVQVWAEPQHFQQARSDLVIAIKAAFEAARISIPYPHQVALGPEDVRTNAAG
jgi:small conductance mechanosensitive channel